MKICYFLYSEARTIDVAVKTWNILNCPNVDVFVHTQSTSIHTSKNLGITESFAVDNSFIKKYLPTANVFIEDRNKIHDNKYGDTHTNFYAYRSILEILNELNTQYDFVIINRLDSTLYIHDVDNFMNNYDHNTIYINGKIIKDSLSNPIFVQDHFFMGSYNSIKYLLENLPTPNNLKNSHGDFSKYLYNLPLNISNDDSYIFNIHIRPNMRNIFNSYFQNKKILNKDDLFFKFSKEFMQSKTHLTLENNWKS